MSKEELNDYMAFRRGGKSTFPLAVFEINGSFIIGVYQGTLSKFDILIKYRQKIHNLWSRIRTPKHIHWAVDILIKLHEDRSKTQSFLAFLLKVWQTVKPIRNKIEREDRLSIEALLRDSQNTIRQYDSLSTKGEYSVKFLILLAKLLMIQEKTNLETAYMFKKLLNVLREGGNIFSVVSIASHKRR